MGAKVVVGSLAMILGLFATSLCAAADEEQVKPPYGSKPGQQLPLLIVDFTLGAHKGHCGCISVMIRNAKARAVVVAAREVDDQLLALSKSIDEIMPVGKDKSAQGFFVLFDEPKVSREQQDKLAFKTLNFGKPRNGGTTWFSWVGLKRDSSVAIFFINQSKIEATWQFASKGIDTAKQTDITEAAKKFIEAK